ncbi:hypothetical protein M5G24_16070 [Pseudomonas sp. TNT2022 ID1048]|uniref:hypothetical protein n=1 Tax=Pseudomonas idahonensis TaxID=2942628 RepID=UPI00235F4A8F|nr:hypothetical protein [Pseudomonas idahonensis]MDD1020526.1 hypothetical protein [Pseudomonas idahonensis]
MDENYKLQPKLVMLSIGFVIGSFMGILFAASLLMFKPDEKPINYFEGFSLVVNTIIAITAIGAIAFSYVSSRMQKNQWLNESFIRREADILLELRDKFATSSEAVHFFLNDILDVDKRYGFIVERSPIIKCVDLARNFNVLLELNNLYNHHQHIFRKHKLEKSMECISLLLESARNIPEVDIKYELIYQSEDHQTYRMEPAILEMVVSSFNWHAHFLHDTKPGFSPTIEQLNIQNDKDQLKELYRLRELTSKKLVTLMYDLDRLTMYLEPKSSNALQSRSMRYFQKKNAGE